jgi:SLT domain-containing protein
MKRLLATIAAILTLSACGASNYAQATDADVNASNTDPRKGWVRVFPDSSGYLKRCDGQNLLYAGYHEVSVVKDAGECAL